MSVYSLLYFWNARLGSVLGIFFNAWLILLVLMKTPKEMRVHSRILLQTCTIDLLMVVVLTVGTPVGKHDCIAIQFI